MFYFKEIFLQINPAGWDWGVEDEVAGVLIAAEELLRDRKGEAGKENPRGKDQIRAVIY